MAIVAKKRKVEGQLKGPQPNVLKLLTPTEFHPNGRIQMEAGRIKGPQSNIIAKLTRKTQDGRTVELPVNGGHVRADGSVWRVALRGPARYVWKLMRDEMAYRLRGSKAITAPRLVDEEFLEARQFAAFLLAKQAEGKSALPPDFLNRKFDLGMRERFDEIDAAFYAWRKKQDKLTDLPPVTAVFALLPA